MTSRQKELVEEFGSLSNDLQRVLEVLAAAYYPRSRTEALKLVNDADALRPPRGSRVIFTDWKPVVAKLLSRGLLVEVNNHIQSNPVIMEAMMMNAARTGRLNRWIAITKTLRIDHRYQLHSHSYRTSEWFLEIRNCIHQNNAEKFGTYIPEYPYA